MSVFFPRFNDISPIFRLADELDRATRHSHQTQVPTFAPKFDVRESKESYELKGELPGIEQSNVNIEWSDEHTLTISGRTESRFESSSEKAEPQPEVTEPEVASDSASEQYQKPSVEEEGFQEIASSSEKPAETTVTKTETEAVKKPSSPKPRYWVTERSVGSFHRTFHFPGRVDHDAVKAQLKNGILSIVVPKAKALEPKKITIN